MKKLILIIGVMAAITIVISQTVIGVRDYIDRNLVMRDSGEKV